MNVKILNEFIRFAKEFGIDATTNNLVKFRNLRYNMV